MGLETQNSQPPAQCGDGSHLYVMQQIASGLIKIGRSADPKRRRRTIESLSGQGVVLLLKLANRGNEEAAIHAKLAAYRGIGEWFANTQESRRDICTALGAAVKFRYAPAIPSVVERATREGSTDASRHRRDVAKQVRQLASQIMGQEYPPEWDEAHDAEEEAMCGRCSYEEVNAIRERVGLAALKI